MRRITFGIVTLVLCVAVFTGSAVASSPLKTPLNITINREVAGICAFPIRIQGTQTGHQIDFFDADGRLVRRHRHGVEEVTLTANGQTLTADPFHFNIIVHFGPTGAVEHAYLSGLVFRVPLPDGTVFQSAGRLDFIAQGVNFAVIPEVGASGDVGALCDALSG
jgi:hypothetical protein